MLKSFAFVCTQKQIIKKTKHEKMKKHQIELEPGKFYHIYNRGNNSERIFFNEGNYEFFLRRYNETLSHLVETYAFCLLPNHFHFLIRVKDLPTKALRINDTDIPTKALHLSDAKLLATTPKSFPQDAKLSALNPSSAFHRLFTSYSKAINKQQNRHGSLFENPFKRIEITSDEYLKNLIIYIHTNPQLHGFVETFKTYKWSSYNGRIINNPAKQYKPDVIKWFENNENFEFCHEEKINIEKIKHLIFD